MSLIKNITLVSVSFPFMINFIQDMTLLFEEKGLTKETYSDDSHPLYIYLHGDVQTRCEVILNHPDVIGFVCDNVLALLAPPHEDSDKYMGYVNASKNVSVDRMLDQPDKKEL